MRDDPKWNIQFVKLVEKYPVLYDAGNEGYCSKDSVEEAWRKVASAMRESVINCKDKWRNLRTSLTRHLRNMNEPSALSGKYRRPYYMAPYMSFLIPYTKSRSYRTEFLSADTSRRSSFDSSLERRCPADRGDSSSYDISFGVTPQDHETPRPQDRGEDHHRQGLRTKGPRANPSAGGDHLDVRRVQPKVEEPDDDVGAEREDLDGADGDNGGGEGDLIEEEEEEEEEDEGEEENTTPEEWDGGGGSGGAMKRRRVATEATAEDPPAESACPEGAAASGDRATGSAAAAPSRGPPGAAPGGPRAGRAGGEQWDMGAARELDDDSWSCWLRDGDWDACAGEERKGAGKGPSGGSRLRISRVGHQDARSAHAGVDHSNPDMDFFRSILSDVNTLNPAQRSKFRLSVLKTLHEMLYEES